MRLKMNKIQMDSYYRELLNNEKDKSRQVGWRDNLAQIHRFQQLYRLFEGQTNIEVADVGCGLAEFYNFLNNINLKFNYIGYDISKDMVDSANLEIQPTENGFVVNHINTTDDVQDHDFLVASGIFNMKRDIGNEIWFQYIVDQLNIINKKAQKGFAFNMLTSYSDKEFMRDELYYGNPSIFFDYCKKNYSKNVALLHDYNEYDFTIIVRR
jgi:SAM-dependent methyltransferase